MCGELLPRCASGRLAIGLALAITGLLPAVRPAHALVLGFDDLAAGAAIDTACQGLGITFVNPPAPPASVFANGWSWTLSDSRHSLRRRASLHGGLPLGPYDVQCVGQPWRNKEGKSCGLGAEIALVLAAWGRLRHRRAARRAPR